MSSHMEPFNMAWDLQSRVPLKRPQIIPFNEAPNVNHTMGHSINRYHLVNIWLLYLKRSIWFNLGLSAKPCRWIISFYPNSLYQAAASLTTLCGQLTTQRYTWNMRFKKRTTSSSSQTQFPRTRDTWALQIKLRLWRRCSEYIRYITSQVLQWRLSRKEWTFSKHEGPTACD